MILPSRWPPSRPVLYGRAGELAVIDRLLAALRAGRGGALAIRGEPGIGKSALLAYASRRAEGLRVLTAVVAEGEARLAHATLQQLLRPLLGQVDRLPPPQARALGVAVGLEAGEPPDRFLVAVATLTLLSEVAEERPLLCMVDDAHWADAASLAVLGFVARRLEGEPVALLVTLREGEGRPLEAPGLPGLPLTGLDAGAAAALLEERWAGRLAPAVRRRLLEEAGGNPLALLELPAALSPGQRAGTEALEAPLPVAGILERAFLDRVRHRPAGEQALLLAAAEGTGQLATVRRAARGQELDPGALASGRLADLVRVDGPTVEFRHPLVRSAVYHGASAAARTAAHQALAEALGEDQAARRAWHRAQATDGPDEAVAGELERAADQTLRRAGHAAAAAALERAAELSAGDEDRARRLAAAAMAAWRGGDTAGAAALLDRAERLDPRRPGVRLDIGYLRGSIELRGGDPVDGARILAEVAATAVGVDGRRAVLEALWAPGPLPGYPPIALYATPDLVEAAVRAGQPARCRDQLAAWLREPDPRQGAASPALAARCRALTAPGGQAGRHFEEALRLHALAQQPFGHARTQLLYGEHLRRQRHRIQARPQLRGALEAFRRLGCPAWAERARRELRATGETVGGPGASALDRLTPQELQIARGVVEGATNREIAAQLFVSPAPSPTTCAASSASSGSAPGAS